MKDSAAHNLLGITLKTGWKVINKITKTANATGSVFSVCYKVEKDGNICFLKAFNFTPFFQHSTPGQSMVDVLNDMLIAYKYERDLSDHCKNKSSICN
jgi:hypothetical protein